MSEIDEIDKQIAELQARREEALRRRLEEERRAAFEEARDMIGRLPEMLTRLHELGYCPRRLEEALTDGKGKFNPGMYLKRPRSPFAADEPESLTAA